MVHDEMDLVLFVRDGDYERFLCIQLAPALARPALYAVTAFSIELAHVAHAVRDALPGHIRLAWWRDALEEIAAGNPPRNHPVVLALAALHPTHSEISPQLAHMVEARAMDLDGEMTEDETIWLSYLDGTAGALHAVWATLLDAHASAASADHIAAQARAYAMIGLVRAMPYHVAHGLWRFPLSRIAEDLQGSARHAAAQSLVEEALHMLHADHAMPKPLLPLAGLAKLARMHGQKIVKQRGNPYAPGYGKLRSALRIAKVKIINK
jgi:phytoene synthase